MIGGTLDQHRPLLGRGIGADPAIDDGAARKIEHAVEFVEDQSVEALACKWLLRIAIDVAVADDERTIG